MKALAVTSSISLYQQLTERDLPRLPLYSAADMRSQFSRLVICFNDLVHSYKRYKN